MLSAHRSSASDVASRLAVFVGALALVALLTPTLVGCAAAPEQSARSVSPPPPARPTLAAGPACEMLGTSEGCPDGSVCCPLPPTLFEQPRCLADCRGARPAHCEALLGQGATCNAEDGCCFWPKVRGPTRAPPAAPAAKETP